MQEGGLTRTVPGERRLNLRSTSLQGLCEKYVVKNERPGVPAHYGLYSPGARAGKFVFPSSLQKKFPDT